ncbi:hypothetical protein H9623_12425 [Oerskovia sp. Sa1BUA8]|uniref:Uncharacterized protein n=1 Tax=Oerskovia douganii TaxID=2762210 RepID=A0A9D5U9P0_9CELL|nr:hypothetical protein [Oerskovia douganii]MBE7701104.1 hypothetical protein [Oerskovia douganii]
MALFARSSLPDDARRSLHLAPKDAVLASAQLTDGSWAVATRTVLATTGDTASARPWCDVDRAGYDPGSASLTVEWVDGAPPLVLHLADVRRTALAQAVRERVQSSVVLAEVVALGGGRSAKVAVRRDTDGSLFSQVVAEAGVDLEDPRTRAVIDAAEDRVRSMSGLPL